MDELTGAQRGGKRAVAPQKRNVGMGVTNCLQGWALKEEMIARVLSLHLAYTTYYMCLEVCLFPLRQTAKR